MLRDIRNIIQITFIICTTGFFLGVIYGACRNFNMMKFTTYSLIIAFVSFIPTCYVVIPIYEAINYGEFHFKSASQIHDYRVQLPPEATDICIHKFHTRHYMKFHSNKTNLDAWYNSFNSEFYLHKPKPPVMVEGEIIGDFAEYGWLQPAQLLFYDGPTAFNGAGFDIYYDEQNETAYLRAAYW